MPRSCSSTRAGSASATERASRDGLPHNRAVIAIEILAYSTNRACAAAACDTSPCSGEAVMLVDGVPHCYAHATAAMGGAAWRFVAPADAGAVAFTDHVLTTLKRGGAN